MENYWAVGSRYEVQRACSLSDTPKFGGKTVLDLEPKDEILLLSIRYETPMVGFAMPSVLNGPHGWVNLDENRIRRQRLPSSWEIGGRYCTKRPCKLRVGKSVHSPDICLLECGLEVLVLDLAVDVNQEEKKARLRAHVHPVDSALFGWLTPEPTTGARLLEPFNLLGPEVVTRHSVALKCNEKLCQNMTEQSMSPWKVGCSYRVLEEQPLRENSPLTSKFTGKVAAGTVIEILDSASIADGNGYSTSVQVRTAGEVSKEGWLRCVAKDGHNLIDTRDQLGPTKAAQLLNEQSSNERLQQQVSNQDGGHNMQEERSETSEASERRGAHIQVDEDTGSNSKRKCSGESGSGSLRHDVQQAVPLFNAEPLGFEDDPADMSRHGQEFPQVSTVIEEEKFPFCAICVCQRSCKAKIIERL